MDPFTAPVWSERRGLFPAGRPRPCTMGSVTSASIAGLSGDPMSWLPGREVVSAGVGVRVFLCICARAKCLNKDYKVRKIPENEASCQEYDLSLLLRLVWIWLNTVCEGPHSSKNTNVCVYKGGLCVGGKESFNLTQDIVNLVVA